MTVTFCKRLIVGVVLILLAGCSLKGETPVAGELSSPMSDEQMAEALETCLPEAGAPFSYRKAILVAGTIGIPDQARDLPGLAALTSVRLQTHLEALKRFNVQSTHDTSFESLAPSAAARVRYLGRKYASQFVAKLELQDLTVRVSRSLFSRLLGGSAQRHVLITLYIYDTEYGALFHSQRYERTVRGDIVGFQGNGRAVTTPWFSTDLGTQIDDILIDMSKQIEEKLACVPFATEISALKNGQIHIGAGYLQGIRPGDTLRVYPRSDASVPAGAQRLAQGEGWIKVNAVFPDKSIAGFAEDAVGDRRLNVGDIVRAW